jgi:hypothetical protein
MAADAIGELAKHDFGRGMLLGGIMGLIAGILGTLYVTWFWMVPERVADKTVVLQAEKQQAEAARTAAEAWQKNLDLAIKERNLEITRLRNDAAAVVANAPIESLIMWRSDKPETILGDLQIRLLYGPSVSADGSFQASFQSEVFRSTLSVSTSDPVDFSYKGKSYTMVVQPAKPLSDGRVRVNVFNHKP